MAGITSSAGEGSTASAGPFYNGVYVIVPLQVLGDGGDQEPEGLHCHYIAVHDGGVPLKSTIISTVLSVLSSRLLRLHQTASFITFCL